MPTRSPPSPLPRSRSRTSSTPLLPRPMLGEIGLIGATEQAAPTRRDLGTSGQSGWFAFGPPRSSGPSLWSDLPRHHVGAGERADLVVEAIASELIDHGLADAAEDPLLLRVGRRRLAVKVDGRRGEVAHERLEDQIDDVLRCAVELRLLEDQLGVRDEREQLRQRLL